MLTFIQPPLPYTAHAPGTYATQQHQLRQALATSATALDVTTAKTNLPTDRQLILDHIGACCGHARFTHELRMLLLLQPLDYGLDLTAHLRTAGSHDAAAGLWDLGALQEWVHGPVQESRAVAVLGGAGLGKTTLSALIASGSTGIAVQVRQCGSGPWSCLRLW